MELQELATRLGLALALGFVIGLERGWKEREEGEGHRTAGIRTFSLIGLLGGIFGMLSLGGDRILIAAGFVLTGAVLAAFMWREGERGHDYSATTLVAALLTFMLGAAAVLGEMAIAAGAGVATVGLLAYKRQLHGFLARITWDELRSGLLLGAMTFIALPLLPDADARIPGPGIPRWIPRRQPLSTQFLTALPEMFRNTGLGPGQSLHVGNEQVN